MKKFLLLLLAAIFVIASLTPALAETWTKDKTYTIGGGGSGVTHTTWSGAEYFFLGRPIEMAVRMYSVSDGVWRQTWAYPNIPQMNNPLQMTADKNQRVFVADGNNSYTKMIKSDYSVTNITTGHCDAGAVDKDALYAYVIDRQSAQVRKYLGNTNVLSWGSTGQGNGQFGNAQGIAYAYEPSTGYQWIYVADSGNNRIQKFTLTGGFIGKIGTDALHPGDGNYQFNTPKAVACDYDGNVYVLDTVNGKIKKYNPNGVWMATFGTFVSPTGIFIEPQSGGKIWVSDNNGVTRWYKSAN